MLSINPDRVVVKRELLTGQPFKTKKKKATVRFMFNHPDDVRWFRSCALHAFGVFWLPLNHVTGP